MVEGAPLTLTSDVHEKQVRMSYHFIPGATINHEGQNARLVSYVSIRDEEPRAEQRRFSLLSALLNWLGETPAQKKSNGTPGYLTFGMASMLQLSLR